MATESFDGIFTQDVLKKLFPEDRADQFFDALFGDAEEGAYDISLEFKGQSQNKLEFEFHLKQRPGKCLACNLTYGLPQVFSRHGVFTPSHSQCQRPGSGNRQAAERTSQMHGLEIKQHPGSIP